MDKLSTNNKIDVIVFSILVITCIATLILVRANSEVASINLSGSELSCKKSRKHNNYQGYFNKNNESYFTSEKYDSCEIFVSKVSGKEVTGKYLKSNNLLVELRLDGKIDTEHHFIKFIYYGLFLAAIIFCFIRKPIHWLASRYV